ncbi:putative peroxisome biogenesis factor 1 [Trypanosoma theileri]|uniref:Peroxisomal ATPase PEX1 n=1 Tax=Trypanosoma theileri TaxID=67003 RepID=A0A1X0PA10_9TRYP|nr:putative peroxisome biogenesis factor 1 [Trypanosoma theileri]ORC93756.1 putative peroxisome biogenesis factor 1 [Trypanosoma theileri]
MQRTSFEVSIDPSRTDAFVRVSANYINSNLIPYFGGNLPPVVPLCLSDGKKNVYVGCLTHQPHNLQPFKLLISIALSEDIGLQDGKFVQCIPVYNPIRASKVLVSPTSVDDSEVVEQNASRIEGQLLRQVQVVYPGMTLSVAVFSGVHAKVTVQKIEDENGQEITSNCAVMFDGTEFVIATRARQIIQNETPKWTVLRSITHNYYEKKISNVKMEAFFYVNSVTAKRYNWSEGNIVGFWDLARMSKLIESKQLTPSFFRSNAWKAPIRLTETLPDGVCLCMVFDRATNVVVFPNPDEAIPNITEKDTTHGDFNFYPENTLKYEEIVKVHEDASRELLQHLKNWFGNGNGSNSNHNFYGNNGNILLCGAKGYGKTAILGAVLNQLCDVHVCFVQCSSSTKLLSLLQEALIECVMCAPSVLVLDNFDAIAPLQKEGSLSAISGTTKSMLEETLRCFTETLTLSGRSSVVVIAKCGNREDVHESLRSASCFPKVIKVEALNRKTRMALLQQLFPNESTEMVEELGTLMDNYTPFDIKKVSARIKSSFKDGKIPSLTSIKETIASFTPLSHTGITFLKGEKQSLNSIGGLSVAKKVLYDTLVLPMKNPALFSRLPLKTRSGVLLYGPPGCGKTFVVESIVNAEDLHCIVVNGPEIFGKYIGQSEQKIRDIFERAQAAAPCVIFFDEFDSVAPQRGVDNSGVTDRVVNQLLCYLDGVEGRKDVYVVAASSRPDLIDAALLRPGRLDKLVQCPLPSLEERLEILNNSFKKTSANLTQDEIETIAKETENWTPADLVGLVSSANLFVTRRVIDKLSLGETMEVSSEANFALANIGSGTTREKIEDSLKTLLGITKQKQNIDVVTQIVMGDVRSAMELARPSLSQKEILKYERIHHLFSGENKGEKRTEMGKKLVFQ